MSNSVGSGRPATASVAMAMQKARGSTATEELRVVVELQVLAERLEAANQVLRLTRIDLDRRVAERTAELETANAALASANRVLEERVQAEVAAREAAQSAKFRQQKLEALGQLTGGVAHDFNNLLTVVLSGLHMLGRAKSDERREQLIERIAEAVGRGASLTHRLLAFSRRQALLPQPLDLTVRLADLGELLGRSLRGDLRIATRPEEGVWPIEVDHGALELALLTLAVNARDAMPYGGTVTLAARNLLLAGQDAAAAGVSPGEYVELSVADTGTGMTPAVLARVFEPFVTTKEDGRGSGLGLAQVYGFAQQSGGTARVHSEPGEGCTVSLLLPRASRTPPDAADTDRSREWSPERPPPATRRSAAVLVVEDDDEVAALMVDLLIQFGHAPTRVSSVEAALGALRDHRPLDVVFSDVMLQGGGSGLDLAQEIERRRPGLPIVLTTGYGGEGFERVARLRWPVLRKPFLPKTLEAAIAAALPSREGSAAA